MCFFHDIYTLCERCGALAPAEPRRRSKCVAVIASGRAGYSCRYFEHKMDLIFLAPTCTDTRCYWCYVGRAPPADMVKRDLKMINEFLARCYLTHKGVLVRGSAREEDKLYGPARIKISRRE
ncbi:hypothetical protein FHL15_006217 [Xylaria flabelliformis]|uniref:Uncharacterized protein n=1 Tax=Xylaria flabelliformis TaxID=2512241 RepID=A0A553HXX9_9PEZI|nr:hypothetical protein FHL15_006217 [Xylaria flabelliformis]